MAEINIPAIFFYKLVKLKFLNPENSDTKTSHQD